MAMDELLAGFGLHGPRPVWAFAAAATFSGVAQSTWPWINNLLWRIRQLWGGMHKGGDRETGQPRRAFVLCRCSPRLCCAMRCIKGKTTRSNAYDPYGRRGRAHARAIAAAEASGLIARCTGGSRRPLPATRASACHSTRHRELREQVTQLP